MKTLDEAINIMKSWEAALDNRDVGRFTEFIPFNRIKEILTEEQYAAVKDEVTEENWGEPAPWTEEEILGRLKSDINFAIEKAERQRGISADCMFHVVNMWCTFLEGPTQDDYDDYGLSYFRKVKAHYNL